MALPGNCNQNTDPLKLVREGTNQDQRLSAMLKPTSAPVDEHTPAHGMVFAQAYSVYLKYYASNNAPVNNWRKFFSSDVSVQLAIAAIQDVDVYKHTVKSSFDYLNNLDNDSNIPQLKAELGKLYSVVASLAKRLDTLKENLPEEIALRGALQNLIQSQLATGYQRLLSYYDWDQSLAAADQLIADAHPEITLFGTKTELFATIDAEGLSVDWITDNSPDWATFRAAIVPESSVFGSGATVFDRVNHIATHNLFTSVFDQFLKVFARVVSDAEHGLEATFTDWDQHQPHYALFLSFLRLYEYVRAEANTLTGRHLDFYYREVLRLKEKPAKPGQAHLLIEPAKHAAPYEITAGTLFKAGKDDLGGEAFYAADRDVVINQAKVSQLKTLYRHVNTPVDNLPGENRRIFASPIANSEDGLGAELISVDQSWHPFFNKVYVNGVLTDINMPEAEIGFVVASHYLHLAEGVRTITLDAAYTGTFTGLSQNRKDDIVCLLSAEEGWIEKTPTKWQREGGLVRLVVALNGDDPAVTPYVPKVHGYNFDTDLPVILCKLKHRSGQFFRYHPLRDLAISKIDLTVSVTGHKTLALSNDFGVVDPSKPFQPFGAIPANGNNLIIGSTELFQKKEITSANIKITWKNTPTHYTSQTSGVTTVVPTVATSYLSGGEWSTLSGSNSLSTSDYPITNSAKSTTVEAAALSDNPAYQADSRHGFVRLVLKGDLGFEQYQKDLGNYLTEQDPRPANHPGNPILGPFATAVALDYTATQPISLNSSNETNFRQRQARFFHLAPFGQAEQHPYLNSDNTVYLLPQFEVTTENGRVESEAELYIGLSGLQPPQNLTLLFQVVDGTADPLSDKPDPHLYWSYLSGNEWTPFQKNEVEDQTDGLLKAGIVTLSVPREAADDNTLLPSGLHWIRVAVREESDAVSRLQMVAAQALSATFINQNNDPAFPAKVLPAGTISKLNQPVAAVKKVIQPFATFGGRGAEAPNAFYTRVSERLRHKDRAITLWDYERLILEEFPQIYKVKCLNHTQYEPNSSGTGIYRELAPGHVTIVTVPNQLFQNLRDPLRPYTSLGLLEQIDEFIRKRLTCFARLHVRNPEFEEVRVSFKLRLFDGFDETFYTERLKEAITRFLSPWAFSMTQSPTFGGKVYKSVLINFVEEQPYVDYVTDFQLFHDLNNTQSNQDKEEIAGATAVSILVSVPAEEHTIDVINPAEESISREKCDCEA